MRRIYFLLLSALAMVVFTATAAQAQPGWSPYGVDFGSVHTYRTPPTTGTLTGQYTTAGNWTQTGPITCNRCRIHVGGAMTINDAITVGKEAPGAPVITPALIFGDKPTSKAVGVGAGPGGDDEACGGGGGGFGGAGGTGGSWASSGAGSGGGNTYDITLSLVGSGGGSGCANDAGTPNTKGGDGGGCFFAEVAGAFTMTSSGSITAVGEAGSPGASDETGGGGGGSGGSAYIVSQTSINLAAGAVINVTGGAGGNGFGGPASGVSGCGGGGGGAGVVFLRAPAITNAATITLTGGAAGTNAVGGLAVPTAGGAGVSDISTTAIDIRTAP